MKSDVPQTEFMCLEMSVLRKKGQGVRTRCQACTIALFDVLKSIACTIKVPGFCH